MVCVIIFIETSLQNAIKSNISNIINTDNNIFRHQYQGPCQLWDGLRGSQWAKVIIDLKVSNQIFFKGKESQSWAI